MGVRRSSLEEFITKAIKKHGCLYDYSLVDYIKSNEKIKIICRIHGIFEQTPSGHLKQGCIFCSGKNKLTTEEFILRSKKIHGDEYDYSLVNYINKDTKVKIICKLHGEFEQRPGLHVRRKQGCPKCNGGSRKTSEYFIEECKNIYKDKYDYSLVEYINAKTNVKIICPEHGIFEQQPTNHLNNSICPNCKTKSIGENKITDTLKEKNIKFIKQHKFESCRDKRSLPFDFYLPDYNTCIEYDGIQHYKSVDYFGGDERFKYIKNHDNIKNIYCSENNIKLLRIKYNENIQEIMNNICQ